MDTTIKNRIERLRTEMNKKNLDGIMILSDANRRYLSGYSGEDGNFDESAGCLVISQKDLILATDSRYDTQARNEAKLYSVVCYKESLAKDLPKILMSAGISSLGVETSRLTVQQQEKISGELSAKGLSITVSPAEDILKSFRTMKDEMEVQHIKDALSIAEIAFLEFRQTIAPGMTEKKAAWNLERAMRNAGADSLSFHVIAAAGQNSALPHAIPGLRQFREGEPLLFDFGARLNGYCSDTTRTLIMGKPDARFLEVYDTVFNAQAKAVAMIGPGVKCSDVDAVARSYIDASSYTGTFGHSLGHGVGIAIHEAPRLSKIDDTLLKPGMVVTVEPGIYLPDWGGIRLENMILVTETGAEVLNTMDYSDFCING
ncbi:MAG: Xaa-Pro peptidase family protein [Pseudomonadota bacterium]